MAHRKQAPGLLVITMLGGALLLAEQAPKAEAALRHLEGTVLSKDSRTQTFRIATQNGGKVRIKVNADTRFQRIQGQFSGLHKGLRVEVEAKRTSNGLLAKHVEPHQRGGGGGGADDGPGHQ
jgi:hypothetical protein